MSTNTIPHQRGDTLEQYLFNRFIERFATKDEIESYIASGVFSGRDTYSERVLLCNDGVISSKDYGDFLKGIIDNLPKQFPKKKAKKMLVLIDLYMGPKTFEAANVEKESRQLIEAQAKKLKDDSK